MQPSSPTDYKQLISEVIKKQIVILGPDITLSKARNVKGITVADDGTVTDLAGSPQDVTQALIDQFVQLSGLIVKKTMEPLLSLSQSTPHQDGAGQVPNPTDPAVQPAVMPTPVETAPAQPQPATTAPVPTTPVATQTPPEVTVSPVQPAAPAPAQSAPAQPEQAVSQQQPSQAEETTLQPAKNPLAA